MNWWQTLTVTIVPVLLTLIITNFAESRRRAQDVEQRERDRDAERQAREEARRASIEDHWRDERLTRMTTLVDVVSDLTRLAVNAQSTLEWGNDEDEALDELRDGLANEARKAILQITRRKESALPQAITRVAVIASQRFYVHSLGMLDEVRENFKPLLEATLAGLKTPEDYARVNAAATAFAREMSIIDTRLINAVREELTGDTDSFGRTTGGAG